MKFNPKNKKKLTYGDIYYPMFDITDAKELMQYFKDYCKFYKMTKNEGANVLNRFLDHTEPSLAQRVRGLLSI
jgi:hypothetical protein